MVALYEDDLDKFRHDLINEGFLNDETEEA